jgi:hypothetical protein
MVTGLMPPGAYSDMYKVPSGVAASPYMFTPMPVRMVVTTNDPPLGVSFRTFPAVLSLT